MRSDKELLGIARGVAAAMSADEQAFSDVGRVIAAQAMQQAAAAVSKLTTEEKERLVELAAGRAA